MFSKLDTRGCPQYRDKAMVMEKVLSQQKWNFLNLSFDYLYKNLVATSVVVFFFYK
jgi:hypothetical protein